MKAVLMTDVGEPEVLKLREVPTPDVYGPSEVLVRLKAAGVNPVDTKVRRTHMYYPGSLPAILGCDGAGVVEKVGPGVKRFKRGDEVFFFNNGLGGSPGNYAQYAVVHEDFLAAKPRNLSMAEAAALPLVFITAWESLVDRAALMPEHSVLIHAGAGGVGHVAIQLAHALGAYVATTVSSDEKAGFVRTLGAGLAINYREHSFVEATLDWTEGVGVRVVMDTVGGRTFCQSFAAARIYGRVVSILSTPCDVDAINIARLRNLTVGYVQMTAPLYLGLHGARKHQARMLDEARRLAEEGKLRPAVSRILPLEEAAEAHRIIEEGHVAGKVVLDIP
ncbi:MAG TPA: zinc-dependent alcohol dehydrogenase family protein [Burkholderiales bacterium]